MKTASKELAAQLTNWADWELGVEGDVDVGAAEDTAALVSTLTPRTRELLRVEFIYFPLSLSRDHGGPVSPRALALSRADAMGVSHDIYETLYVMAVEELLNAPKAQR